MLLSSAYIIERMGELVKKARLKRNESQLIFAARLGVHRHTLAKMEAGDSVVRIGAWVEVLRILDLDRKFLSLLASSSPEES